MARRKIPRETRISETKRRIWNTDLGSVLSDGPGLNRQTPHAANVRIWWGALRNHPQLPDDLAAARERMTDSAARNIGDWWPVGDEWPLVGGDVSVRRDALEQILREEWDGEFTGAESVRLSEANIIKMNLAGRFLTEAVDPLLDRYPNLHTISPNLQREHVGIVFRSAVMRATSSTREGITAGWAEAGEDLAGALWASPDVVGPKIWGELWSADTKHSGLIEFQPQQGGIEGHIVPRHQQPAPAIVLILWPGASKTEALQVFGSLWKKAAKRIELQAGMHRMKATADKDYKALVGLYGSYVRWQEENPQGGPADFIARLAKTPRAARGYWPDLELGEPSSDRVWTVKQKLWEATGWLARRSEDDF